jgi:uroporphyrinogen-III synthase
VGQHVLPITLLITKPSVHGHVELPNVAGLAQAICLPAFELSTNVSANEQVQQWLGATIGSKRMVVFVSPGSIELTRQFFPPLWPENLLCGLMGEGSAAKAQQFGIPQAALFYPTTESAFSQDSAGLFYLMQSHNQTPDHMLIVKGPRGRKQFAQDCVEAGVSVKEVCGYHRNPTVWATESIHQLTLALNEFCSAKRKVVWSMTSSEAVENIRQALYTVLPSNLINAAMRAPVLTTHTAISWAAREAGFESVHEIAVGEHALQKAIKAI